MLKQLAVAQNEANLYLYKGSSVTKSRTLEGWDWPFIVWLLASERSERDSLSRSSMENAINITYIDT